MSVEERKEYLKKFMKYKIADFPNGSHDGESQIRGDLGYLMKQLKESDHNDSIVEDLLKDIYNELKLDYDIEIFKKEYHFYLSLIIQRQNLINNSGFFYRLSKIETLDKENWNNWGSYKQFLSGKIIVDELNKIHNTNIHSIWGCLLNPTGGITGPGNRKLMVPQWNSGLSFHSCAHDAYGYLLNYHGIGPGFNYLNTYLTFFPRWYHLSCQVFGIYWWKKNIIIKIKN